MNVFGRRICGIFLCHICDKCRYEVNFTKAYIKEGGNMMKSNIKRLSLCLSMLMLMILASPLTVLAAEEEAAASTKFYGTFWSLVPPIVAIALALITKEVYSS